MDVIQAIKERRSINFFETGKELSDDKIRELLEISNLSPSSFNLSFRLPFSVALLRRMNVRNLSSEGRSDSSRRLAPRLPIQPS